MQGKWSDGKSIMVTSPTGGTVAGKFYRVGKWHGVAATTTIAGDQVALMIDQCEIVLHIPNALAPAVGDVIYMPAAGGESRVAATLVATANDPAAKVTRVKDANDYVLALVLPQGVV